MIWIWSKSLTRREIRRTRQVFVNVNKIVYYYILIFFGLQFMQLGIQFAKVKRR
jgi:hypothetical protein